MKPKVYSFTLPKKNAIKKAPPSTVQPQNKLCAYYSTERRCSQMKHLIINDDYKIGIEEHNKILYHKVITEKGKAVGKNITTGKPHWKEIGYYPTVEGAVRKYIYLAALEKLPDISTIKEYLDKINEIFDEVKHLIVDKSDMLSKMYRTEK